MRIAFFVGSFPSTSETFVLNQVTGLLDRGHEVFIYPCGGNTQGKEHGAVKQYGLGERTFSCSPPGNTWSRIATAAGLLTRHLPAHPVRLLKAANVFRHGRDAWRLARLKRCCFWINQERSDFDVILCHFGPHGSIACDLRRQGLISGKIATVFHAYDLTQFPRRHGNQVYRELFAEGDLFMPITAYARNKLLDLGCPKEKTVIHHMGVDCTRLAYQERNPRADQPFNVVTVGRMVEKKGFEYAIRAIAETTAAGHDVRGRFVGDGRLRPSLEELATTLGIRANVEFVGWQTQEQIARLLDQSHAMLVPSVTANSGDEEGLPVVLMEALAMGLPVVSTRHAGIPELIADGKTGFLVEERDSKALADRLGMLIDNGELSREMSRRGRRRVEEEFNIEKLNNQLVATLTRLVNGM
ncbi:MAG: glycosyltransferase [Pirellulales bacterium]|nr:glycosyltransferase [Pirellulales bacterium]